MSQHDSPHVSHNMLPSIGHATSGSGTPTAGYYSPLKKLNGIVNLLQYLLPDDGVMTMPQSIGLTVTTACNLRCPHCQTHGTEEAHRAFNATTQTWSSPKLMKIAEEVLPFAQDYHLTLSGEPLLYPNIEKILENLNQYGAKIAITTNGTVFSRKTLLAMLPYVGKVAVSIDGATKGSFETLRLGANFESFLNKVRLLTECCELLQDIIAPRVSFACTVMASNIKEMPEMIKLASLLRIPIVDFHPMTAWSPTLRNEEIIFHKPLYNAYYCQAKEEGERLGIMVNAPAPFPEVKTADPQSIAKDLSYRECPTSPERYLDYPLIQAEAAQIATTIRRRMAKDKEGAKVRSVEELEWRGRTLIVKRVKRHWTQLKQLIAKDEPGVENRSVDELEWQGRRLSKTLRKRYGKQLKQLRGTSEQKVNFCGRLFYGPLVGSDGDVAPCCMPGRPTLGNINEKTLSEIWNGKPYVEFRRAVASSEVPECCRGCRYLTPTTNQELIAAMENQGSLFKLLIP